MLFELDCMHNNGAVFQVCQVRPRRALFGRIHMLLDQKIRLFCIDMQASIALFHWSLLH